MLDRLLQIGGDDILSAVVFEILVQRAKEVGVAERGAQHLQHPARLAVDVSGIFGGVGKIAIDDGHGIEPRVAGTTERWSRQNS